MGVAATGHTTGRLEVARTFVGRRAWQAALAALAVVLATSPRAELAPSHALDVYALDVEGGKATLVVSPSGESLLLDAGNPGARDAGRIATVAKQAGVTAIDYLVISHFHADHVGGVAELARRLPIRTFVDNGQNREPNTARSAEFQAYLALRAQGRHVEPAPGDTVPVRGLDVRVVTSNGVSITKPLGKAPAAGIANPLCRDFVAKAADNGENAMSVGLVVQYGRFRLLDLGDLPWNQSRDLVCPANLLGTVDVYLTSMHGLDLAGPAAVVHALRPRIVVMNNGPRKGASHDAWTTIRRSPALEDLWQLHYSVARPPAAYFGETADTGGPELNVSEPYIANLDEAPEHDPAYFIKISARTDGGFTVLNSRNGFRKEYTARR